MDTTDIPTPLTIEKVTDWQQRASAYFNGQIGKEQRRAAYLLAAAGTPWLLTELAKAKYDLDMYRGCYFAVQDVLSAALGPNEEDGAGEGIAADVHLLAEQRDEARAEAKRWKDVADALSVKLTGVTAEGLVAVPRPTKCEAPQSDGCQYPPTHIAEYLTGKTSVVAGEQLPVTHRIPVCGACVNDVPNLHRVQLMGGPR